MLHLHELSFKPISKVGQSYLGLICHEFISTALEWLVPTTGFESSPKRFSHRNGLGRDRILPNDNKSILL